MQVRGRFCGQVTVWVWQTANWVSLKERSTTFTSGFLYFFFLIRTYFATFLHLIPLISLIFYFFRLIRVNQVLLNMFYCRRPGFRREMPKQ